MPRHGLSVIIVAFAFAIVVIVDNFRLDVYSGEKPEALGHALGHQTSLCQSLSSRWTLLKFQNDLDDSILLVQILGEIPFSFLGCVAPVLLCKPLLHKASLNDLFWAVLLHELSDKHEREFLCHVAQSVLIKPFVIKLVERRAVGEAVLQRPDKGRIGSWRIELWNRLYVIC